MGSEAKCRAQLGGKSATGTALLETDELLFRAPASPAASSSKAAGALRLRIPLRGIQSVRAEDGTLVVVFGEGEARFALGALAEKWRAKIQTPPSLLDKLGVTGDMDVLLVGDIDATFEEELTARAKSVRRGAKAAKTGLVLLGAATRAHLARLVTLRAKLRDDGAVWVVYPKGKAELKEADVLAGGRAAGFKDVKVARFSETHTALKFMIPREARGALGGAPRGAKTK